MWRAKRLYYQALPRLDKHAKICYACDIFENEGVRRMSQRPRYRLKITRNSKYVTVCFFNCLRHLRRYSENFAHPDNVVEIRDRRDKVVLHP